jgi:hypothetical protein
MLPAVKRNNAEADPAALISMLINCPIVTN